MEQGGTIKETEKEEETERIIRTSTRAGTKLLLYPREFYGLLVGGNYGEEQVLLINHHRLVFDGN